MIFILGLLGARRNSKCLDGCHNDPPFIICASDGKTYLNPCEFLCEFKEINDKMQVLNEGTCKPRTNRRDRRGGSTRNKPWLRDFP